MHNIDEYLRKECEGLKKETESLEDSLEYVSDIVDDAVIKHPEIHEEEIEKKTREILKELWGS